eukprot:Selendium_serpulae@DN7454_c0_g1_i1.p1
MKYLLVLAALLVGLVQAQLFRREESGYDLGQCVGYGYNFLETTCKSKCPSVTSVCQACPEVENPHGEITTRADCVEACKNYALGVLSSEQLCSQCQLPQQVQAGLFGEVIGACNQIQRK